MVAFDKLDIDCKNKVVNDVPNKKKNIELHDYSVKRIMKKSYNQVKKDHPYAEVLVKYKSVPNVKVLRVNISS